MIPTLGNILQIVGIFCSILSLASSNNRRIFFTISSGAFIAAFLLLVFAFAKADFSVQNVFFNSSTLMSATERIPASWSSHEGSMLLMLALLSALNIIALPSIQGKSYFLGVQGALYLLIAVFIVTTSNPFAKFSFSPKEGLGLNPLLQDVALMIHPPILYIGYLCYGIIYSLAVQMVLSEMQQVKLLSLIKKYSAAGLSLMSAGIALGSWWAYRELGWGGYWFFDPVENISLIPWLFGVALHHFLIKDKKYISKPALALSLLIFPAILLGIFFVRSGLLVSVHSFGYSPQKGIYLFLIFLISFCFGLWVFFNQKNQEECSSSNYLEKTINYSAMLWIGAGLLLMFSVIYPAFYFLFGSGNINIDQNFFIQFWIPVFPALAIILLFSNHESFAISVAYLILLGWGIVYALDYYKIEYSNIEALSLITGCALIMQNIYYMLRRSEITKMLVAHLAFGMLLTSISLNTMLSFEVAFKGGVGKQVAQNSLMVRLDDISYGQQDNYFYQSPHLWVNYKNTNVILKPEYRLYSLEKAVSAESSIYQKLLYDLYAICTAATKDSNGQMQIEAIIYYNPMISLIWISAFLMFASVGASLLRRRT